MKRMLVLAACCVVVICATQRPAHAITADLAKKCRALSLKAYPYKLPGAPKGDAGAERQYFATCISKNGDMPTPDQGSGQSSSSGASPSSPKGEAGSSSPPAPAESQPAQK